MALINYRVQDGLAIIELNNPPANAYTLDSLKQLDEAVIKARFDTSVHVLVVHGAGEKFFSAGADINMLSKESSEFRNQFALFGHETLARLENTPKLVIAAINGHCVGGGLEIAMACDIRIAKKNAGRTGLAEVNLGVIPGMGGTQRLPRLAGKARAMDLAATGRMIAFEEALEFGLINEIFEGEDFFDQILDYARQFVAPNKPSKAVGLIKRAIQSGMNASQWEGLALERELLAQAFQSADAAEGLNAYQEKRIAKFQGK
ncbi:MAG: enoyl-CoA hydratase [Acidobacteria bacterium]|nr:MAG: enoyl-CoA hydratase [Acidobacteriota bacterium]